MDKLYTRIDEKLKLGSDFTDWTIFPSLVEVQATEFVKQQESYVMQKLVEFQIDPNTLENQLKEIYRLNEVVRQLEDALDKACDKLSTVIDIEGCNWFCKGKVECNHNCATKEYWKEWLLKEVQEDE